MGVQIFELRDVGGYNYGNGQQSRDRLFRYYERLFGATVTNQVAAEMMIDLRPTE